MVALMLSTGLLLAWLANSFAQARSEGNALVQACETAETVLDKGEAEAGIALLTEAGITDETAWRLPTSCAETRAQAIEAADDPTAAEAARSAAVALACSLATAELERGYAARALAILDGNDLSSDERAEACGATATTAANLVAAGFLAPPLTGAAAAPSNAPSNGMESESGAKDGASGNSQSPPARAGMWWDEFAKAYASPLATAPAWILASALALFVLARLLVELPGLRSLRSARIDRTLFGTLGWVLLVLVPMILTAAGISVAAGAISGGALAGVFGALAGLGLVASLALAAWLATRLRITINVTQSGDAQLDRARVIERLRALAGRHGGHIELPASTDVAALNSSLTAISDKPWLAAAQNVMLFLVGVVPWDVSVDAQGEQGASVIIARNRRTLSARRVRTEGAGLRALDELPGSLTRADVLATFVAGEILMALRPWYPSDFAKGLYGATVADSIALQHIAVTWYMTRPQSADADELLSTATQRDPFNRLAQASLMSARYRNSQDLTSLVRYRDWVDAELCLDRASKRRTKPRDDLERGLLFTRAAIARNFEALLRARPIPATSRPVLAARSQMSIDEARGWPPGAKGAWEFARIASAKAGDAYRCAQEAAISARETARGVPPGAARYSMVKAQAKGARIAAERARASADLARLEAEHAYSHRRPRAAWRRARAADDARKRASSLANEAAAANDAALRLEAAALFGDDQALHVGQALHFVDALLDALRAEEESLHRRNRRGAKKGATPVKDYIARIRLVTEQKALVAMLPAERRQTAEMLARSQELESKLPDDLECSRGDGNGNSDADIVRRVPALAYGWACYLTRWKDKEFGSRLVEELLDAAVKVDVFAAFAKDDPELSTAIDAAGFEAFAQKATATLEARELKAVGVLGSAAPLRRVDRIS